MVTHAASVVSPSRRQVPLVVGDLSARSGGQIAHHASHRTGRDVDLLFFARDAATGASVLTPEFIHYNRTGASVGWPTALRFDAPRNWELVEALVRTETVGLSWIFVAAWLERILIDHARAQRRPEEVIARAEALMHQPGDSAPHDDHFHVRVLCTPEERAQGCLDWGPIRPWNEREWEKGDSAPCDDDTVLAALEPLEPRVLPRRPSRRR
jgi:penicillin-insensitive murein endopeptidase